MKNRESDDDVWDFSNQDFLDDDDEAGGGFLEAKREAWVDPKGKPKPAASADASEDEVAYAKLRQRAEAALEARHAKEEKQKKEIPARFGGGRQARAADAGGFAPHESLEDLKLEFLREMQADGPNKFVTPEEDEDDHFELSPDKQAENQPHFTTDEVWEELEYDNRKHRVVDELGDASQKVTQAKLDLPRLRVDNMRLERLKEELEHTIADLQKQELKLKQRYPELAKERAKAEEDVARSTAAKTAKELKERQRQEEKIRLRQMKRRTYIERTVELMEEQEKDFGDVFAVASSNIRTRGQAVLMAGRVWWMRAVLKYDPMTQAIDGVTMAIPRLAPYFKCLRWQILANSALLLVTAPQVLSWLSASQISLASDTIYMPSTMLYSSVPRELNGSDMAYAYGFLSILSYLLYAYATVSQLLADAKKYVFADVYQTAQATDKFAKIVFNAMNLGVQSTSEAQLYARQTVAKLQMLIGAQKDHEKEVRRDKASAKSQASSTPMHTVWAKRLLGGVASLVLVTAPWVLIELLVDAAILENPNGIQRLIAPVAAAVFNSWVMPLLTPYIVLYGEFPKESRATQILVRTFLGRLANIVIILRRSVLTLMDEGRVWDPLRVRDTCYCEDEVGVTLFYYWGFDWAAGLLKVLAVPLFFFLRQKLAAPRGNPVRRAKLTLLQQLTSFERPEFDVASWIVDATTAQTLLCLAIPLLPSAIFFGLLTGVYGFALQRVVVVNFWQPPTQVQYPGVNVRVGYMLVTCCGLVIVTGMYAFLWLFASTATIAAPVCQLPVLYINASAGSTCQVDAATGATGTVSCAPYRDTSCAGRGTAEAAQALYQSEPPYAVMSTGLGDALEIFGSAPLAWGIALLLGVRAAIQSNYRARFQSYVEEKRYVLLLQIANLEKTLKKQDKILAIQWNE